MLKRSAECAVRVLLGGAVAVSVLLATAPAWGQFAFSQLRAFGFEGKMGASPTANLIQGSDGLLYGTTHGDDGSLRGTVFSLNANGTGYRVLHRFTGRNGDGALPWDGPIEGRDGALYGTTLEGGRADLGIVFRLDRQGVGFTVLHSFGVSGGDAENPRGGLVQDESGFLYGTAEFGGAFDSGTVFRLRPDGSEYATVRSFGGMAGDGVTPSASLLLGADGALYGITRAGGGSDRGSVFRLTTDGADYRVIHGFGDVTGDGVEPRAGLLLSGDGLLYGTTRHGGTVGEGCLFRLSQDGIGYRVIHSFSREVGDGANPFGRLIEIQDGILCGTAVSGGKSTSGVVFGLYRDGTGYRLLHNFGEREEDGILPYAGLVQGQDGALYGTTWVGGRSGFGIVFRLDRLGAVYDPIWHFTGAGGDGAEVFGGLMEGDDGILYGTTLHGGSADLGTVFKLDKGGGEYELLHGFAPGPGNGGGAFPYAGLVEGRGSALYGTASGGGGDDLGVVFKLEKTGEGYGVLHRFAGSDGSFPFARLLVGSEGVLFGTTTQGGASDLGTVFRLNADGSGLAVLHSFVGGDGDGANSYAGLIEGNSDAVLYGTTWNGGGVEKGTVFRMAKDGSGHALLRTFTGTEGDGANPYADLLESGEGLLYGVTAQGGSDDLGTIFKLNANGSGYSVLHRFSGADGRYPYAALIEASDGALYGTTWGGGGPDQGLVFRLRKDGAGYEVVHAFADGAGGSANPWAPLVRGREGGLYGATVGDGLGFGGVFELTPVCSLSTTAPGEVVIAGPAGYRITLQGLTGLGPGGGWQDLTDVTLEASPSLVTDPTVDRAAHKLYRAVLKP